MSPSKSKCWCSDTCLHFLKCARTTLRLSGRGKSGLKAWFIFGWLTGDAVQLKIDFLYLDQMSNDLLYHPDLGEVLAERLRLAEAGEDAQPGVNLIKFVLVVRDGGTE